MLFKTYASPFDFLDGISQMGMFEEGLSQLIEKENEDKLWQLYLTAKPNKSFNDWKFEILNPVAVEMSQTEITTEVKKAEEILQSFNPERG